MFRGHSVCVGLFVALSVQVHTVVPNDRLKISLQLSFQALLICNLQKDRIKVINKVNNPSGLINRAHTLIALY